MFFQFSFKALHEGKTISGASCKPGDNIVFVKPSDFPCVGFHDGIAHGYLPVAADDNGVIFSNRKNGCAFELIQWVCSRVWDGEASGCIKTEMGCDQVIFKSLFVVSRGWDFHRKRGYFSLGKLVQRSIAR